MNSHVYRMTKKRSYRLKRRAEQQDNTRQRIVEAAVQLHEDIGPRATTISAIARTAGVQRLTVYRHFPDEGAILEACSSHWLAMNPPPAPGPWRDSEDAGERFRTTVGDLYAYYSATERMWSRVYRDAADVDALRAPVDRFAAHLNAIEAELVDRFPADESKRVSATIGHALAFQTWKDLDQRGLSDADKIRLVSGWLGGVPS